MSAYGTILKPSSTTALLPSTSWSSSTSTSRITVHHLTLAHAPPEIIDHLYQVFRDEVEKGMTYPQEDIGGKEGFVAYFFAADVFVGVKGVGEGGKDLDETGKDVDIGIEEVRAGREWAECVVGFYYVKPNYPGRSSHICNAGFVVDPKYRGNGFGSILARSYVHYAPKLGYKGSVFNLVYVNNVASIKLWEKLGFTKAGLIPKAGRLKKANGEGEEYVDAWMIYKSWEEGDGAN